MTAVLLTSSILILLLALLRYLLRGRVSLRLQYALWLLVALRLLVPVSLGDSALSALSLLERAEETELAQTVQSVGRRALPVRSFAAAYAEVVAEQEARGVDVSALEDSGLAALDSAALARMAGPTVAELAASAARMVWLAGAAAMAGWFLAVNLRFRRRLRRSAAPVEAPGCPLPVYVSAAAPSPCLCGLLRPAVYLTPACLEDPARLRHVLAHELTHRRHGDPWWALARCACLCLYWFDPLVWWAAGLSRRDCELACDEGALRLLGEPERLAYGRTLVDLMAVGAAPGRLLQTATTMADSRRSLRERITLIARGPRMAAATAACLALAVGLLVGCTFTGSGSAPALAKTLALLPEELADQVTVGEQSNYTVYPDSLLATYYAAADYAGPEVDGFLLDVYCLTEAEFERSFIDDWDHSGWSCFAKDGADYYATRIPTDVHSAPDSGNVYRTAQAGVLAWVRETVLAREGVQAFDCEAYLSQEYLRSGCQYIDAAYGPYLAVNSSPEPVWRFRLVQPETQGDGGVWGVERVTYPDGQSNLIRPDTGGLSSADYYADLQKKAGAGQADWALDPAEMLLRFVRDLYGEGHAGATADSLSLGQPYIPQLGGGPADGSGDSEAGLSEAALTAKRTLSAIMAGESVSFTFSPADRRSMTGCTASPDLGNGRNRELYFPSSYAWQFAPDGAAPPEEADTLTLESQDGAVSLQLWAGSELVRCAVDGVATWLQAPPATADDTDVFSFLRLWYDEAEIDALQRDIVVPDRGQSRREIAQEWVDAYEGASLEVSPGSGLACTYVKSTAIVEEDIPETAFPSSTEGMERFYFSYSTVFVPASEEVRNWLMAGNTEEYAGDDAPEGAYIYFRIGPMYLAADGWRCAGVGTGI